ncbi:hypothetical protein ILUMI_25417 [Ignelater luminosus]|uniref:TNFR-Cys domain-containing protein n=1 Tax=Ignelater luminosus TaxID=2038154 RepID=A0A8K0C4T5_IGNLU|nr:hypothetical protein ILUMI_25417 [Ignelater luminosus]
MKCIKLRLVIVFIIIYFSCVSKSELTISGVQCGSKICGLGEYCSEYERQCKPCSDICNERHHNYQASTCTTNCQDYLHDIRYVRKDGGGSGGSVKEEDLRASVQRLQSMVTVALTLTCITLLTLIVVITILICKWKNDNNITLASLRSKFCSKKSNDNKSSGNGVTVTAQVSGKPDLRLEMPTTGTQSENSPATLTTTISRRPAEDSALDYAYDNHAMSSSPSPNSKPHESNF